MCGCRARAAARAAAAGGGGDVPRTIAIPRHIPRAPVRRAVVAQVMSVSVLAKPAVVVVVVVPDVPSVPVPAPVARRGQRRPFIGRYRRPVAPRPSPPETLVIHDTKVWGPLLWRAIHTAAEASAGRDDIGALWSDFAFELQMSLPCPDCMQHYRAWYATSVYATLESMDAVANRQWWVDLHNAVNARKGVAPWALEEVGAANMDLVAGRDAVAALASMLGPRAHHVLTLLYARLG
jgi:hypothetical protein